MKSIRLLAISTMFMLCISGLIWAISRLDASLFFESLLIGSTFAFLIICLIVATEHVLRRCRVELGGSTRKKIPLWQVEINNKTLYITEENNQHIMPLSAIENIYQIESPPPYYKPQTTENDKFWLITSNRHKMPIYFPCAAPGAERFNELVDRLIEHKQDMIIKLEKDSLDHLTLYWARSQPTYLTSQSHH